MSTGTDVVETAATGLVVPPEFAEFVPDDLPHSTEAVEVWVKRAEETVAAIKIETLEDAEKARDLLKRYAREEKSFKDERVALTKPRKDAAEFIKKQFDDAQEPFARAKALLSKQIADWQADEKRKQEAAQKLRDEERERVEAEAREKREAAERAQREADELAEDADNDEDAAVAGALSEEARRDAEKAGVMESAIRSLPPAAPVQAPKISGFTTPEPWTAEVVDFGALPDTLPDGTPLKVVDQVALNRWMHAQVKANGGVAPELPGAVFEKRAAGSRLS